MKKPMVKFFCCECSTTVVRLTAAASIDAEVECTWWHQFRHKNMFLFGFSFEKKRGNGFWQIFFVVPKSLTRKRCPYWIVESFTTACDPFEPETFVYKRLFPLDDEPNLYIKNGCLTTNIHVKTSCLGYPWSLKGCNKKTFVGLWWAPRISPQFAKHGPCVHAVAKAPTAGATSTV